MSVIYLDQEISTNSTELVDPRGKRAYLCCCRRSPGSPECSASSAPKNLRHSSLSGLSEFDKKKVDQIYQLEITGRIVQKYHTVLLLLPGVSRNMATGFRSSSDESEAPPRRRKFSYVENGCGSTSSTGFATSSARSSGWLY